MQNPRFVALNLLLRMSDKAYSNLVLDKAFDSDIPDRDKKFISSLFYGVIERCITLDYVIDKYLSKPIAKLDKDVLCILELGVYQLLYMDSVPDNAAVNESVKLAKQAHKTSASGMVNAILRNFIRDDKKIVLPSDVCDKLSVKYSCPVWLVDKWIKDYGKENAIDIMESTVSKPEITVRVNTTKISDDDLIRILCDDGISSVKHEKIKHCLTLSNVGNIERIKAFSDGLFHVQDVSSQLCCMALNPIPDEIILDLCAAPGGKTFTISELTDCRCKIQAFDIHQKRVDLINSGAKRLGLGNIIATCGNAKEYSTNIPLADKILCDVPCAGLGVISKKPEIKYKPKEEIDSLPAIQYDILKNAVRYLKVGGELVYSTCSLSRDENDCVIDKLLDEYTEFEGVSLTDVCGIKLSDDYKASIFPSSFRSDGFFISKIRRIK